jgi:DNA-binding XRE family transcriptional regulator
LRHWVKVHAKFAYSFNLGLYFNESGDIGRYNVTLGDAVPGKRKIALTNLADLRADLGLKLADMACAIKPMTRQTLSAIESGEAKDAIFMHAVFARMRGAFAARFEAFDFVETADEPGRFFVRYKALPAPDAADHAFERLSFQIMELNNRLRRAMKEDGAGLCRQDPYLRELLDTLGEYLKREKAA